MTKIKLTKEENDIFQSGFKIHRGIQEEGKSIFLLDDKDSQDLKKATDLLNEKVPDDITTDDYFYWLNDHLEVQ